MGRANGKYARRYRGDSRNTCSVTEAKLAKAKWLGERLAQYSSQEIVDLTGAGTKAAENLRNGRNKISYDNLVELCRNDPFFRADFFCHCGGYLETDPEFVAGITQVLNSAARRLHNGQ